MAHVWDLLEDTCCDGKAWSKEVQHSARIICAAAEAFEHKTHTRIIDTIEHPDSKLLTLTAQAFRRDFEEQLPQSVRDVVTYTDFPCATADQQARLPGFNSDRIPDSYRKLFLKDTQFIINVPALTATPSTAAKTWLSFLSFLNDANCGYIRDLVFHFNHLAVQLNIRSRVFPEEHEHAGSIRAPIVGFKLDPAANKETCFLNQNETDFRQASDWLRQSFQKITNDRELFLGAGRFGTREVNKVGKTVLRLPALCCWLRGRRCGVGDGGKGREDSGTGLVMPSSMEVEVLEEMGACVVGLPTEVELREHADECGECGCGWVRGADGAL
ncbi:hypothetical protein CLAFUW4_14629 [Fulvia fulva]|nr:hypothetical protein CLAFUR4_14623 [Fulvia fulva]WPV22591.1 hypothetical protein CLAFUW4_14629 [Fulvia fulva]WPV37386.1 hypothetical protein CLAFUW7_14632 [Fulvia fulva]